jgi:hypothetical protein
MADGENQTERTRLTVLLIILAAVVVMAAVTVLRRGGLVRGPVGGGAITFETHSLQALEVAQLERFDGDDTGVQRNPFTFGAAPTPTPRPVVPTPTRVPRTPRPTPAPRMALGADGEVRPPPPPFNREYLGHFGPLRLQVAAFRTRGPGSGTTEIDIATVDEVIDDIFIVREIGLESVVIGFVGYDRSEDTRVPLAEK